MEMTGPIIVAIIFAVAFIIFVIYAIVNDQRRKLSAGIEEMIGKEAVWRTTLNQKGTVLAERDCERVAVFRLSRVVGLRGPGLVLIIPFIETVRKVDLRVITMDVPQQECITVDNVTVRVDAVVYFRGVNAADAILKVLAYIRE